MRMSLWGQAGPSGRYEGVPVPAAAYGYSLMDIPLEEGSRSGPGIAELGQTMPHPRVVFQAAEPINAAGLLVNRLAASGQKEAAVRIREYLDIVADELDKPAVDMASLVFCSGLHITANKTDASQLSGQIPRG